MVNRDTYPYAGPIRAVHRVTKEVRGWTQRDRAEDWLRAHDDLDDWDLEIDDNPAWSLAPAMHPGPDGRMRDGRPVYATPDGKPPA